MEIVLSKQQDLQAKINGLKAELDEINKKKRNLRLISIGIAVE